MRRALIVTSVASMILQFNMDNIRILQELGYQVDVACNFLEGNTCTEKEVKRLRAELKAMHVGCCQIPFARNITQMRQNMQAYRRLRAYHKKNGYDLIHCQSPIGGVLGRLAAVGTSAWVIYTAHGFHFYKGAPKKNWLLYFPVEWLCSWLTDELVTINEEDTRFAKKRLHAKRVRYVPGIGVDAAAMQAAAADGRGRTLTRRELGLQEDDILLFAAGELSERKNHRVLLETMRLLADTRIHLMIAGQGDLEGEYQAYIAEHGLEDRVRLLGYRTDLERLLAAADIYVFPSLQEGLPVALMEAMASGLPCVVSQIRGNTDLIGERQGGLLIADQRPLRYAQAIQKLILDEKLRDEMSARNQAVIKNRFDRAVVCEEIRSLYE